MQPELDGLFWKDRSIRCGGADAEQTLRAVVRWWRDRAELPVPKKGEGTLPPWRQRRRQVGLHPWARDPGACALLPRSRQEAARARKLKSELEELDYMCARYFQAAARGWMARRRLRGGAAPARWWWYSSCFIFPGFWP